MDSGFYAEYSQIETTHWWSLGRRSIFLDLLRGRLAAHPQARLLDVGCGTGAMLGLLQPFGTPIGVDVEASALGYCRDRGCERLVQASANALPFLDATFDLVTAFDIIEHMDDDVGSLAELGRVCRDDGQVLLSVPAYSFLWGAQDEISHHRRRYTRGDLAGRLHAAGLRPELLTYFNTFLFPIIAGIRLARRFIPEGDRQLRSDFTMTKPGLTNAVLTRILAAESPFIRSVASHSGCPFSASPGRWVQSPSIRRASSPRHLPRDDLCSQAASAPASARSSRDLHHSAAPSQRFMAAHVCRNPRASPPD
ncbi:MAG: Methyltransferase type 11 [Chloroflexi bacterium]|nr:Methyltransferase type 11 [Chloroflexota bacterium]